jgi:hypothetical protein
MNSFVSRVAVAGVAVAVPAFALVFPAGAATGGVGSLAAVGSVAAVGSGAVLPTSDITGKPAVFKPASLKATAKLPSGGTCSATVASFRFVNKEKVSEAFTLTATGNPGSLKGTMAPGYEETICTTKGYTGTATVALTDKKKLTVKY